MNSIVLLVAMALVGFTTAAHYTEKFDNVNVQEILDNPALMQQYKKCMLSTGKCTPEGKTILENLQDALSNKCESCTEKQKEGIKVVIKHLVNKDPETWEELKAKHDPTNKYSAEYEKELREILA